MRVDDREAYIYVLKKDGSFFQAIGYIVEVRGFEMGSIITHGDDRQPVFSLIDLWSGLKIDSFVLKNEHKPFIETRGGTLTFLNVVVEELENSMTEDEIEKIKSESDNEIKTNKRAPKPKTLTQDDWEFEMAKLRR